MVHMVLVHGSRFSGAQWAPQLPFLRPHVSVGLPDLPGHGRRAGEQFSLGRSVEVIDEAVSAAPDQEPVVLVGHSLGGYAAMSYAQHHSHRLTGLVLAGCSATPKGLGASVYQGVAALADRAGPERLTWVNDRVLRARYPADVIEPVIDPAVGGGYWFESMSTAWSEVMEHSRPDMLAEVSCPVLFLNGQLDQFRLGVRDFLAQSARGRVEILPRASHLANLDRPRAFAEALLRFTAEVDRA